MAVLTFTCRRCGVHGGATVVHEVARSGRIRPKENSLGYEVVNRDAMEVVADHYYECAFCNAAEHELADLFTTTTGAAT